MNFESFSQTLRFSIDTLKQNIVLVIAGMFWWACHYLTFWNPNIVSQGVLGDSSDPIWLTAVTTTAIVLGILAPIAARGISYANKIWSYILIGVTVFGGLIMFLPSLEDASFLPILGAVLVGLGTGLGHVVYGELHTRVTRSTIPLLCACEMMLGILLYALFVWTSPFVSIGVAAIFVFVAIILFSRYAFVVKQKAPVDSVTTIVDTTPLQITALAFFIGLTYGLLRNYLSQINPFWATDVLPFEMIGSFAAGILLIIIYFNQKNRTLLEQCLIVVIPFVAAGMALLPLYSFNSVFPLIIHNAGFACFFVLLWYYAMTLSINNSKWNVTTLIAFFFCAIETGQVLGAVIPSDMATLLSSELVFVLLLFLVVAFARQRRKIHHAEKDATEQRISEFSQSIKLTPRESEVFILLMERKSYKEIEESLVISSNTVKTHVKNIYQKANVSSREELLKQLDVSMNALK